MTTWIEDDNGNKCSVEYFGSEEAAKKALDSLVECRNCTNCSDCSYCSDCSGCSYCAGCAGCSYCSYCSYCSHCSRCSDCSYCSHCSRCSDCSDCSDCSRCSDCAGCSRCSSYCSGCSHCSDCSYCWYCSHCSRCSDCSYCLDCAGCSRCSYCSDKKDARGDESNKPPPVPTIENIHAAIYAAVSAPDALQMDSWHTCENTHCRAGWAVTLAGEEGRALERFYNTELAAMMIYDASDPGFRINPARFYDENDEALEDMRRLANPEKTDG